MNARIAAVVMQVRELWIARRFYGPIFEWSEVSRSDDHLEYELSGGQRISFHRAPDAAAFAPSGISLEVPDVELLRLRLTDAEARPVDGQPDAWHDPDGNVIRLSPLPGAGRQAPIPREEFVGRIADVLRRSGVEDAEMLVRGLESSVHFPLQAVRCGRISSMYHVTCVRPPEHDGYCEGPHGEKWTRVG